MPDEAAGEAADRALLTPVLRTVGNVAAGGGAAAVQQLLSHASGDTHSEREQAAQAVIMSSCASSHARAELRALIMSWLQSYSTD